MANPLVTEGFIKRRLENTIRKKGKNSNIDVPTGRIEAYLVGMNDAINICANACACCWDKQVPTGYQEVAEYVAKRARTGHTSILEHSNFVLYISIDKSYSADLVQFLSSVRYLNTRCFSSSDGSRWHLIIGGSLRGYADLYRESDDLNNPILKSITHMIYTYAHSAAFEDICSAGLLNKNSFLNAEPEEYILLNTLGDAAPDTELYKVVGLDNITKLYTNLYRIDSDAASYLTTYDLIKFVTITVLFKNMSRTCTHQLVRHRNAITQESQRYVNYSEACFNSPEIFKPEKYDASHKYTIRFGPSGNMHLTLSEIGDAMCKIYGMLQNPAIAGQEFTLMKEDARAFLPSNVQCKKIYMTFTLKNFLKFLNQYSLKNFHKKL